MPNIPKKTFLPALFASAVLACAFSIPAGAAGLIPIFNAEILGGSSFVNGAPGSFSGNLSIDMVPVFELTDDFSFIPRYCGAYTGVKTAADLQGAGALYQQAQDHTISFKFMHLLADELTIKYDFTYLTELTLESASADWAAGLYNNNRSGLNFEAEKGFAFADLPCNLCAGYSFYSSVFPNYASLAGTEYGRQLMGGNAGPGTKVFDYNANEISASFDMLAWSGGIYKFSYVLTHSSYPDQNIVTPTGGFTQDKRADLAHDASLFADYLLPDLSFGGDVVMAPSQRIIYEYGYAGSNQNYFDVPNLKYTPSFYNFSHQKLSFPFILRLTKPFKLTVSATYEYFFREYESRTAQDALGNYTDQKLSTGISSWLIDLRCPLAFNLSVAASAGFSSARSNMKYEKFYRYSYDALDLLAGIRYEY